MVDFGIFCESTKLKNMPLFPSENYLIIFPCHTNNLSSMFKQANSFPSINIKTNYMSSAYQENMPKNKSLKIIKV